MRAGKLKHRIEVQAPTNSRADDGGTATSWATEATRWGSIDAISGREFFEAAQTQSRVTHRIRMRFYDGLTSDYRLVWDGRAFEIDSVVDVGGRGRETVIMAIETVDLAGVGTGS